VSDRRIVAVMFTDMVGYTALMQADERLAVDKRDRYWRVLESRHDEFDGTIVQRLGDGSMSMFPSALDAVRAGTAIQRSLSAQDIHVRIGVHVGEVIVETERLTGEAVNIAARIESFAVPGGVMLSDSAYDQVKNRSDVGVVRLGRFKLKNVGRPFELYALSADGVVVPDPTTLVGKGERFASLPSNLPSPSGPLVGREADCAYLVDLVRQHRVVTVTGPGGVGKTRILVELGRMLAPEFLDGLAYIALADVADPTDFLRALANALDVKEAEERTLGDGVAALVADRNALLLLDNMEQIVSAGPDVATLIERCPALRIVVTSRAPLRIGVEREYALSPLALDPAVALFVERARGTRPSFELTAENSDTIAALCSRLDGLPLALELAAARLRILSPEVLLDRLDHALDVLTSGSRDSPGRQQTLRATIDWSHSLLTDSEQRLFRRMAVFASGFAYEDVDSICGDVGASTLDELESLADKALVQVDGQGDGLRMLETIREYARERLEAAGEAAEVALLHARRYADVAREIRDGIEGTKQRDSIERGIAAEANLDAAIVTLAAAARAGDGAACELGLQLSGDLWMYWHIRGKHLTAREHTAALLDAAVSGPRTIGRAGALLTAGLASWTLGQFERANTAWEEAHSIAADLGADRELCIAGFCMGIGLLGFDVEAAREWSARSAKESGRAGFIWAEALAFALEGIVDTVAGDAPAARARFERALVTQKRIGDHEGAGLSLGGLAQLASVRGELAVALDLYRQSLAEFEAIGDRAEEARILSETAWTYLQAGDSLLAREYFLESVQAYTDLASVRGIGLSLIGLSAAEVVDGRPETAVQVAAAAEVYAAQEGIVNVYSDETPGQEFVDRARAALTAGELARATETGRRLTITEVLDLVRAAAAVAV